MSDEFFNIEIEFTAHETQSNMEKGSIYLDSKFTSYKSHQQPIVIHRMGHMQTKSSLALFIKEVFRYIPFINYICNCEPSQQIVIQIVENFNNADYFTN